MKSLVASFWHLTFVVLVLKKMFPEALELAAFNLCHFTYWPYLPYSASVPRACAHRGASSRCNRP